MLSGGVAVMTMGYAVGGSAEEATSELEAFGANIVRLEAQAQQAYAQRDFPKTVSIISELMYQQPNNARWSEMRAQVLVDGKNFSAAIMDYNESLSRIQEGDAITRARLIAGRALALEGLGNWAAALKDYQEAQRMATSAGETSDPYVTNSIGNCQASLGQWQDARASYLESANTFQASVGYRDRGGRTTARVDGAIYAATNAALMLAQLGDLPGAKRELEYASRRGPGSVDARAALAALYYQEGRVEAAESTWEFACDKISVGCSKYTDREWLSGVRRWPPVMVDMLGAFLRPGDAPKTA